MQRFVIGLEHDGYQLKNDIVFYVQATKQPSDGEHIVAIYNEIISQIIHACTPNLDDFSLNILQLPAYSTINFTDDEIPFDVIRSFGAKVRAFAIRLWGMIYPKMQERFDQVPFHFVMESVTETYLVLAAYPEHIVQDSEIHDKPISRMM